MNSKAPSWLNCLRDSTKLVRWPAEPRLDKTAAPVQHSGMAVGCQWTLMNVFCIYIYIVQLFCYLLKYCTFLLLLFTWCLKCCHRINNSTKKLAYFYATILDVYYYAVYVICTVFILLNNILYRMLNKYLGRNNYSKHAFKLTCITVTVMLLKGDWYMLIRASTLN